MADLDSAKFSILCRARRVWAVGAVRGEAERLEALHAAMAPRYAHGDRLVYLGNMVGVGQATRRTLDEVLRFRRWFLARPPYMNADDVVLLRGSQEEMWRKLLQLQFASEPMAVYEWMLAHGLAPTVAAYGGSADEGRRAIKDGMVALTRWTSGLRTAQRAAAGHGELFAGLRRAAMTDDRRLLFVNAGLDPALPLDRQGDQFWWDATGFRRIDAPYQGFARVVRGAAADDTGIHDRGHTLSLDGGCGLGGTLVAACLDTTGAIADLIEV